MATLKQIQANRRNASQSTGPRSPEGKATSRLNAARALRPSAVLRNKFRRLCADLKDQGQGETRVEQLLIKQMAVAQWNLRQLELCEIILFPAKAGVHDNFDLLDRIWLFETRFENAFNEAYRAMEQLRTAGLFQQDQAS